MSHGMANAAKKAAMKEKKKSKAAAKKPFEKFIKKMKDDAIEAQIFEGLQYGRTAGEVRTCKIKTILNMIIIQNTGSMYDLFIENEYLGSYNRAELIVKIKQSWEIA